MIYNPTQNGSSGGSEKKYKITINSELYTCTKNSAQAGSFVGLAYSDKYTYSPDETVVRTASGMTVPIFTVKQNGVEYPNSGRMFLSFVMPAEDVTI